MIQLNISTSAHALPWVSFSKNLHLDEEMINLFDVVHWREKGLPVIFKFSLFKKEDMQLAAFLEETENADIVDHFESEEVYYLAEHCPFTEGEFFILTKAFPINGGFIIPVLTMSKHRPRAVEIEKRSLRHCIILNSDLAKGQWLGKSKTQSQN